MKTLFITIFHGHIARNILLTPILALLKNLKDVQVVLLVPDFKKDYYQKSFGGGNIMVEGVPVLSPTSLDKLFRWVYYFFVDNQSVKINQGLVNLLNGRYIRYGFERLLTKIFGNIRLLRKIIRNLDRNLVQPQGFDALFSQYKPDLVFISSITSDQDSMVLREADRRGVRSLAMVRSWDNFSVNKGNVRIYPDKLLVHNRFLADDAVRLADFPQQSIVMVGMPHFDFYVNESRLTREELAEKVGINPAKKFIFFLMIGLSSGDVDKYIIGLLEKFIATDPAFKDFELVVRPHPNTDKLVDTVGAGTLVNYPKLVKFEGRLSDREFTKEDMDIYASLIYHSAVVVSYQGTGNIDSAALDRPVINIYFDDKPKSYLESIKHQYDYVHNPPIFATGGIKLAKSEEDLRQAILNYVSDQALDREGRKALVSDQCYILDGKASERVVHEITQALNG